MSINERKKRVETIAENLMKMEDEDRSYIIGYMTGKEEERQKWENKRGEQMHTA